jgi:hypothetical protein
MREKQKERQGFRVRVLQGMAHILLLLTRHQVLAQRQRNSDVWWAWDSGLGTRRDYEASGIGNEGGIRLVRLETRRVLGLTVAVV